MDPQRPHCHLCGRPLAADHCGDSLCSPCRLKRRDYNPKHDPQFADRLLGLLTSHQGQPIHVYRELGIQSCGMVGWKCVQNHVERFRRHGVVIVGRHDGTYTYVRRVKVGGSKTQTQTPVDGPDE